MAEKLLDLSTLTERAVITIDGQAYEMRSPEELPVQTYHQMAVAGRAIVRLMELDELDDEQLALLTGSIDAVSRTVLIAPEDVHAKLSDRHKLAIARAFTGAASVNAASSSREPWTAKAKKTIAKLLLGSE